MFFFSIWKFGENVKDSILIWTLWRIIFKMRGKITIYFDFYFGINTTCNSSFQHPINVSDHLFLTVLNWSHVSTSSKHQNRLNKIQSYLQMKKQQYRCILWAMKQMKYISFVHLNLKLRRITDRQIHPVDIIKTMKTSKTQGSKSWTKKNMAVLFNFIPPLQNYVLI